MTMKAIHEVFLRYKQEYWRGSKVDRSEILDKVCETTNLHRKSAVRKFRRIFGAKKFETDHRGRPVKYGVNVTAALFDVWEVGARCCAENLHTQIPVYITARKELGTWEHDDTATKLLERMSLGEMKRRIKGLVKKHGTRGKTATMSSSIKKKVRVYAGPWRNREPGHRQFDTVVHCGDLLKGDMVYSVNGVDPAIVWSNRRAQWNKGERATLASVEHIENQMPSDTKSRHSDSGSEFLNYYFLDETQKSRIDQTRSRAGRKNDNAFVEERNGHIVRKWIGYERYDMVAHVAALNAVYEKLDLYLNHFQAVRRCVQRERIGAKYVRVYDTPQTPYARALVHKKISRLQKEKLRAQHATLNPVTLLKEIATLKAALANVNRATKPQK
jgi:transposase InsO family protein